MSEENKHDSLPDYISKGKRSYYIHGAYPTEDITTGMFNPFLHRKRTWLVLFAFLLMYLILHFFSPHVPANTKLDPEKIRIGLAIFVCIAFLWLTEAMPLAATAILVPILATVLGVFSIKTGLQSFANPLIYIFFGGFALASALAYQSIDEWIANRIMLLSKGRLLVSSLLLFAVTAFLSMWMSNTATTAMMIPLVLGVVHQLRIENEVAKKRTQIFFLLGIAYSASIGGMGSLVGSPPNGIAAQKLGITFQEWLKFGIPTMLILLPIMVIILWIMLKPSLSERIHLDKMEFTWTGPRLFTIGIFTLTAFCWIFSSKISKLLGGISEFDAVVALSAVFILLYMRVLRWRDVEQGTDWGVLILFGGGICLSAVLGKTGLSHYFAIQFSDLVHGWPIILIIGAVTLFVIFLTELSSNTATAALFVPIFYTVATEMSIVPTKLVIPLALAASCAFMLPVATPPNAIVYGTGMIPQKSMMRVGLVLNLVFTVVLTLLSSVLF